MPFLSILLAFSLASTVWAADLDSSVAAQMRLAVPGAGRVQILNRIQADSELDLVVAMAGPKDSPLFSLKSRAWSPDRTLGIFLQRRDQPGVIYKITTENGRIDCLARIERATAAELIVSCAAIETFDHPPNIKFLYDRRSKALTSKLEYAPFALSRLFLSNGHVTFVGTDHKQVVVLQDDPSQEHPFRLLTGQAAERWTNRVPSQLGTRGSTSEQYLSLAPKPFRTLRFGPENRFALIAKSKIDGVQPASGFVVMERIGNRTKQYPLSKSTYKEFARARPTEVQNGYTKNMTESEEIGPANLFDGTLWFGKTFYDGESQIGIGGFGYFDTVETKFKTYSPPEIVRWSVEAILVEQEAVWLGLASHGEYLNTSGGLLRFDRKTEKAVRIPLPDLVYEIARLGDRLVVATDFGAAIVDTDGKIRRFFVDKSRRGQFQVSEAIAGN